MTEIATSVIALVIAGAVAIPAVIFAALGVGEKIISGLGPLAARLVRPWWWLALPLLLMGLMLGYPLVVTIYLAFRNAGDNAWAGLANFAWAFSGEMTQVLGNTLIWLVVLPVATVALAVAAAVLFDKVRYEKLAMTIIVLPTAVSFTAGSIIWRQIYSYQPAGTAQLGTLNALLGLIPGTKPIPWLQMPFVNTVCLIFVALWASLGVAALILSAAVKSVPEELVDAAKLDGAGNIRIFFSITLPHIFPTMLVVMTTAVIFALKVFDIVYVMTNGNFNSNTFANRMYYELFSANNSGHASALAVLLLLAALPVVILNVRQSREAL